MPDQPQEDPKIIIDEDWKEQVQREKAKAQEAEENAASDDAEASEAPSPEASPSEDQLPPASFDFLVQILATQALDAMGVMPRPDGQMGTPNKAMAKHYIDLLGVLETKTSGNLDAEETKLLSEILHQLRMSFLQV